MSDKQIQKSGKESINIQANRLQVGMTYEEARQIAQDVFDANFYKLAGEAKKTARERADELLEKYLKKLAEQAPEAIKSSNDPDMQYALFTAQKEYARIGNKDLGDVLVDILVDRASRRERSLIQIVLNESLNIVPKLTSSQIDALTVVFIMRYTRRLKLRDLNELSIYIKNTIVPFVDGLPEEYSSYQHIEYCGCGSIQITTVSLEELFLSTYPGLFDKGISREEVDSLVLGNNLISQIITPFEDGKKFNYISVNDEELEETCKKIGFTDDQIKQLIDARKKRLLSPNEVKEKIVSLVPEMEKLFAIWKKSALNNLTLTSVGITIAHANIRRKTNERYDLGIWIK